MSNFGTKVHEILARIGKDPAWLAAETGITPAAISKWKLDPNRTPKASSVKRVAKALAPHGVTLEELADSAGYSIIGSTTMTEREDRLLEFMRSQPRAPRVWDRMQLLTPAEQDEVLSLIEAWMTTRRRRGAD
jgi:hypothetical protein